MRRLVVIIALALGACDPDPGGFGSPRPPTTPPQTVRPSSPASSPAPSPRLVIVETPGFTYRPETLSIPGGRPVILELRNPDDVAHSLTVNELSLQISARPGETVRLPFTPPGEGSYEMYCSISGHQAAGHRGRLEIG